jgi:hypothetical protein
MSEVVSNPPAPTPTARSRAFTREVWIERLARFPASGLTPAQFCALEAVSLPSFSSWKRRLAAEATPSEQVPNLGPRLLPVRLALSAAVVELVLPTGVILRLPPGSELSWVRSLVAALGEPSC